MAVALMLVVASFLPLWETDRWWVRYLDYPRIQLFVLLVFVLMGLFATRLDRLRHRFSLLVALVIAAIAWQASHFVMFLPLWPKKVAGVEQCPADRQLALLNANVLLTNDHYGKTRDLIARTNPDVILLLEPGPDWASAMAPLKARYPFQLSEATPSTYGMLLMSRLPMEGEILHRLQPHVPSMRTHLRLRDGSMIRFDAVHPEPPWPGDDSGERDAELVAVGREVRAEGRAAVVMGDLNDVAWSRTTRLFGKVAGMRDPRVGRGFYPTFHAGYPIARWPLDHLFVSPHWKLMSIDVQPTIDSDHFPILFRLCLTAPADRRMVSAKADEEVRKDAREEVREGKQEKREEDRGQ